MYVIEITKLLRFNTKQKQNVIYEERNLSRKDSQEPQVSQEP